MSEGAVIFAYNTEFFNYVAMADLAAGLAKKNLGIHTTIITDAESLESHYLEYADAVILEENHQTNQRVFHLPDASIKSKWRNKGREQAYALSPYEKTLLLDSDYLIFTDRLKHVFDSNNHFACFKDVSDLTGQNSFESDKKISSNGIYMWWATAVYFDRSDFSADVFKTVNMVKDNYEFYSALFGFSGATYRNDFAFSIAVHLMAGYRNTDDYSFPWPLPTLTSTAVIQEFRPPTTEFVVNYYNSLNSKNIVTKFSGTDVHVMNKQMFLNRNFVNSIKTYIDA
jgi:hypothetical protein